MSQSKSSPSMRVMIEGDLQAVMKIEESCFEKFAWKRKSNFMNFCKSGNAFVLCDEKATVVGYVFLKVRDSHVVSIEKIAVDPGRQGQGLGRFILDWVRVRSIEKGAERITLHVRGSHTRALNLYARNGFKVTGTDDSGYTQHNPEGADKIKIAMNLSLDTRP